MAERNMNTRSFLRLASDINKNLSQIIHLSNNLRYNTYHLLNRDTTILANDIFFPPDSFTVRPPIEPPPTQSRNFSRSSNMTRPRRTLSRSRRVFPRSTGVSLPNEVFHFSGGATPDEIGRATEIFVYSDVSTNQLMCPITQQNFQPNDSVLRIRHCGHIFTADRLRLWFRSHNDCPVCRFDIRSTISPSVETMLRDIASQTVDTRDLSNNSTGYEYSVIRGSFFS